MREYQIGSKLLGLQNVHDDDRLVLGDGQSSEHLQQYISQKDTFIRTRNNIEDTMLFRLPIDERTVRWYIVNYQLDADIIGQDFPLEFHILDRREDYIRLLNAVVDNRWLNFKKNERLNDGNCSKIIYHVAYLTFILENNSTVLTEGQREIVQQIHDIEMSQDYLDTLEQKIRDLR